MKYWLYKNFPTIVKRALFQYEQNESVFDIESISEMPGLVHKVFSVLVTTSVLDCTGRNDDLLNFDLTPQVTGCHACLYFDVLCKEETDCCLISYSSCSQRLWLNGEFFSILGAMVNSIYTLKLKKGRNRFCFEIPCVSADFCMSVRLNRMENERLHPEASVCRNNTFVQKGEIFIRKNEVILDYCDTFRFMIVPNDTLEVSNDSDIWVTLFDAEDGTKLQRMKCHPLRQYFIPLEQLCLDQTRKCHCLELRFRYRLSTGGFGNKQCRIYVGDPAALADDMIREAENMLLYNELSADERSALEANISILQTKELDDWFETLFELKNILQSIRNGEFQRSFHSPGVHIAYFQSKLDLKNIWFQVVTPPSYSPDKQYGLLIIASVRQYSYYTDALVSGFPGSGRVICVDITGRGVTLGSYIGEASINEIIEKVCDMYPIDSNRIFIMGHSNGGSAAIVQAQSFPDRYAGLFACGGYIHATEMGNISNINRYFIYAEREIFSDRDERRFLRAIKRNPENCEFHVIRGFSHSYLSLLQFNTYILRQLVRSRKDVLPKSIQFFTERHRHLKAYWVQLDGIEFGKRNAGFHATWNTIEIRITVHNATGLTITVPDGVRRKRFKVVINSCEFTLHDCLEPTLHFIRSGSKYLLSGQAACVSRIFKGNGLLDVYLSPLVIISSPEYQAVAEVFAKPISFGFDPLINVDYPQYRMDKLSPELLSMNAIIFIDKHTEGNRYVDLIRRSAGIQTDPSGYEYRGTRYTGQYCIMQVMENPFAKDNSILYISCNCDKLFSHNLFTRKLILPSYTYGLHPYLNNDALIFDGKTYSRIIEFGMPIEPIV